MRVGVIGAGLQAGRRTAGILDCAEDELVVIAARRLESARALARRLGCQATADWREVVERPDVDAILVCTPPHLHAEMSIAALRAGKHVLCEKPLAHTLAEAAAMIEAASEAKRVLKCGYNHRHYPGIQQAKRWLEEGTIGQIDFIRCRYGICGRPGYEREWRADPRIVSGGQLMEQGIHAIDLFRWFLGDFSEIFCFKETRFFPIEPLEDNAFALFRTPQGQVASLHSSLTQWKNMFSFELFGQDGYILVEGLGGAYGNQRLTLGRRAFFEPFRQETIEFRAGDLSWLEEWKEFTAAIQEGREPLGDGHDGLEAMRMVFAAYEASQKRAAVELDPRPSGRKAAFRRYRRLPSAP